MDRAADRTSGWLGSNDRQGFDQVTSVEAQPAVVGRLGSGRGPALIISIYTIQSRGTGSARRLVPDAVPLAPRPHRLGKHSLRPPLTMKVAPGARSNSPSPLWERAGEGTAMAPATFMFWGGAGPWRLTRMKRQRNPGAPSTLRDTSVGYRGPAPHSSAHSALAPTLERGSQVDPRPHRYAPVPSSKGLRRGTPAGSKWLRFRVTTVSPCSSAVAAISRSMPAWPISPASRPQRRAIAGMTGRMRSA